MMGRYCASVLLADDDVMVDSRYFLAMTLDDDDVLVENLMPRTRLQVAAKQSVVVRQSLNPNPYFDYSTS
jgi:UDP:flavonoid glycosyltransferase YjiC (YdhE family)